MGRAVQPPLTCDGEGSLVNVAATATAAAVLADARRERAGVASVFVFVFVFVLGGGGTPGVEGSTSMWPAPSSLTWVAWDGGMVVPLRVELW